MNIVSPSILAADFANLERDVKQVEEGGATYLHIDVMDGLFVPSISFGAPVIKSIRSSSHLFFDVHLMIQNPQNHIEEFVSCGADGITIHLESTDCVRETLEDIQRRGLKAGLSVKLETPIEALEPYLDCVDMILIMSVEPGKGGQPYVEAATERIEVVRNMLKQHNLTILLEVDGGVKRENLEKVWKAGANVIVSGSGIFSGSIVENTKYFVETMQEWDRLI
ncbi:MAG: ribulose-phosphate 3-epimerase [Eubacteriales bacterium]